MNGKFINILILFSATIFLSSCGRDEVQLPTFGVVADTVGWDHKYPCVIYLTTGNDSVSMGAQTKFRGGMSSKYYKPSFALELNEKRSLAGLPSDDDYVLNANYIDKTFMRHKISYDLFREMDVQKDKSPLCSYVNVNFKGEYAGLYVLMQKVTAKMLGIHKADSAAVLFKEPPVFRDSLLVDTGNYYGQKFPKWQSGKGKRWNGVQAFREFLLSADDYTFAHDVSRWVDLDNVVDWQILLLFTNNSDGLLKNFYLYRISSDAPFRIAIWDYDHSFGRDCDGELNMLKNVIDINRNVLLRRLWRLPEYQLKVKRRWKFLRDKGIISERHFKELLNENDRRIRSSVARNFERWPVNSPDYYDAAGYQEELDLMLQYVPLRLKQLDEMMGY